MLCRADNLPSDVPRSHWAAAAVQEVVQNGLLTEDKNHAFHGEAKVTRTQAVMTLAKLARTLEAGKWKPRSSIALPTEAKQPALKSEWQRQSVTRYALASLLARIGDYFTNGQRRAPTNSRETGKSTALPSPPKVTLPRAHPAYEAVTYLASRRMISADSPLLKPDDKPVRADEMSKAFAQMIIGLNDRLTELGMDENGDTPDKSFHKNKMP